MNLFEKIDDILEQEDNILPSKGETKIDLDFSFDEEMFDKMANFIINLDPDRLSDSQVESVIKMIEDLEPETEEIDELRTPKLAKRTSSTKNQYSKKWYRKNKTEIKRRKKKFRRSSEGRKRENKREKLSRQGKTPTGRKKVRYHVRKRSDRRDRDENLNR